MSYPGSGRRGEKRRRPTKLPPMMLFDGQHSNLLDLNSLPEEYGSGDTSSTNELASHSSAAGVARQQVTTMQDIVVIDDDSDDENTDAPAGNGIAEHVHRVQSLRMRVPRQHDRSRASSSSLAIDAPAANTILPMVPQPLPEPEEESPPEPQPVQESVPEPVQEPVPEPVMEAPKFNCPVCMSDLVEPSSTVCGHIFCKWCIRAAIKAQKKCPTCRKKLTMRNFHRVYLPASE